MIELDYEKYHGKTKKGNIWNSKKNLNKKASHKKKKEKLS